MRRLSLALTALVLCQLALGACVRHWRARDDVAMLHFAVKPGSGPGPFLLSETPAQGHLIVAFAVVAAAVWLVRLIHDRHAENRPLLTASRWLAGLVGLQILLGVQTWFVRFPIVFELPNHWFFNRDLFRSGHVLVGAFILATSAALTLEAWRRASWALNPAPLGRLEGAV